MSVQHWVTLLECLNHFTTSLGRRPISWLTISRSLVTERDACGPHVHPITFAQTPTHRRVEANLSFLASPISVDIITAAVIWSVCTPSSIPWFLLHVLISVVYLLARSWCLFYWSFGVYLLVVLVASLLVFYWLCWLVVYWCFAYWPMTENKSETKTVTATNVILVMSKIT